MSFCDSCYVIAIRCTEIHCPGSPGKSIINASQNGQQSVSWPTLRAEKGRVRPKQVKTAQMNTSTAAATNTIVRYAGDQWNSRIGLTSSPFTVRL
jgi:hypothetical protein